MVGTLASLAVALAHDQRTAAIFVAAAAAVLVTLRMIVGPLDADRAALCRMTRSTVLRLAIANVYRPGALTTSVVLSLGLGLALLVTVIEIDGNLRRQFMAALPERAPAFFFLDIPPADAGGFDHVIHRDAPGATLERVPMLRGRIVAANGVPIETLKPAASAAWVLQSDRGITYANEVPAGSRVVEGEWWKPDEQGVAGLVREEGGGRARPQARRHRQRQRAGTSLITARIANLRTLDWQSLGINFVMVFSPATFSGCALHTDIATLTYPGGSTPGRRRSRCSRRSPTPTRR